jgi:hypothetical protein
MKKIMYEDCNNNIQYLKVIFCKIALLNKNELVWDVSNLDVAPVESADYSGIGADIDDDNQGVYLFQQRILNEHVVSIEHKELMNLFNGIRTIYDGTFVVKINGKKNTISIFDGDIITLQGEIEDFI